MYHQADSVSRGFMEKYLHVNMSRLCPCCFENARRIWVDGSVVLRVVPVLRKRRFISGWRTWPMVIYED